MNPVDRIVGVAVPFGKANVDTDVIISSDHLKGVKRLGLGVHAFEDLRRLDPQNVFDQPRNRGAPILIAGNGFGSGSSREHAVWAIMDMGFRCVIAPGFADIFAGNAFKNGILLITLPADQVERLMQLAADHVFEIDLKMQRIALANGVSIDFEVDPFRKQCLLEGLDEISITERMSHEIEQYEAMITEQKGFLNEGISP